MNEVKDCTQAAAGRTEIWALSCSRQGIVLTSYALYDMSISSVPSGVACCGLWLIVQAATCLFSPLLAALSCLLAMRAPIAVQLICVYLYFPVVNGLQHPAGFDSTYLCVLWCQVR